jgi:hypothetical protein
MTNRTRGWLIVAALAVVAAAVVVLAPSDGSGQAGGPATTTPPTLAPPPTVTVVVATSSTIQPTGKSTRDPNTFTTNTLAGPIQVRVDGDAPCVEGGYRVTFEITNTGPTAAGPVLAQLDLQDPILVRPRLTVGRSGRHTETVLVGGIGELVTVTWLGRTSFPMEVEACPEPPTDDDAAGAVTTTT